ncbi:unnamed protein product [Ostreobium quekettii]|uniref:Transcription factor-like protein DPB n=1 Tax=Ostreobium quekettii TaxID=121088 RepID=A0A8S1J9N9_9CHLO|nr:unnamed protein product [Ostreobium quekettii]
MQVSSYAHRRIERSRRMDHCEGLGRCEEAPGGKAEALAGARRGKRGRGRAEGPRGRAAGKGLRHFSTKVCEKVENKGVTTYNEVADELVVELAGVDKAGKLDDNDEKNIRRRVYDALNVLLAMGIISKEKKQIDWKGLPCSSDRHARALGGQRIKILESIERKQRHLQELVNNYVAIRSLLERNKDAPLDRCPNPRALKLPCIFVQVPASAGVVIQLTEDCLDANFDFQDYPFQLHDEMHVLRQMGLQGPKAAGPLAVQEDTHSAKAIDVRAPSAAGKKQRLARHADLQNAVLTLSKVDVPCPGRADSVSAASNCEISNGTGLSGAGGEYKLQSPGRNHCQHWLSPLKLGCSMPSAYFPAMANHA